MKHVGSLLLLLAGLVGAQDAARPPIWWAKMNPCTMPMGYLYANCDLDTVMVLADTGSPTTTHAIVTVTYTPADGERRIVEATVPARRSQSCPNCYPIMATWVVPREWKVTAIDVVHLAESGKSTWEQR